MIIITGATGTLGRLVVDEALKVFPANEIGVSVRNATKAQDLSDKGIRVREADFKNPKSLLHAFEDADQILVISSNSQGDNGNEMIEDHRNVIEAAKKVGVKRLLYTSQIGSSPNSKFYPMIANYGTEELLEQSGLNFISLRNGFYSVTGQHFLLSGLKDGELRLPKDGPVNWTTHEDMAEGTVKILQDLDFKEKYPLLTSSRALTMEEIAKEFTNEDIKRVIITDEEFSESMDPNLPEPVKQLFIDIFKASCDGDFNKTSTLLEELLGRETNDIVSILKNQANK